MQLIPCWSCSLFNPRWAVKLYALKARWNKGSNVFVQEPPVTGGYLYADKLAEQGSEESPDWQEEILCCTCRGLTSPQTAAFRWKHGVLVKSSPFASRSQGHRYHVVVVSALWFLREMQSVRFTAAKQVCPERSLCYQEFQSDNGGYSHFERGCSKVPQIWPRIVWSQWFHE